MFLKDNKLKKLLFGSLIIAVIIPLINIYFIYPQFSDLLENEFERSAHTLADHMENELSSSGDWSFIQYGGTPSSSAIELLKGYQADFKLRKMKVFSPSGLTVYSTDEADVGKTNKNDYFHQIVAKGDVFSKVVKKQSRSLEGQVYQADVIEIYVPVMNDDQFVGAFELYYDITERLSALGKVLSKVSILPFVVSGFLLLVLIWGMRSLDQSISAQQVAENELKKSLDDLADKNQLLDHQHKELKTAHDQLKMAQSQMLQREKMASIGQLAAGVAHEINNPMGFISGNLRALQKYIQRLAVYDGGVSDQLKTLPEEQRAEVKTLRKEAKIDFMLEDIPELLEESLDGAERVKEIVQNLKSFSHVDEAENKPANINECLESTLKIIWNELKYKVTLEKDYGDLPQINCFPQQLNQVFMNILVNASHAFEDEGTIHIATRADDESVYVTISDNGCGIPPEIQSRIFEPFFTTKDVGSGTGLGMSIAYEIIEKHGGQIELESEVGKGTTFTVSLPVKQPSEVSDS